MSRWLLGRVILFLAFGAALASTHFRSLAQDYRKPGQHWLEQYFRPGWLEFYEPKGRFYLRISRWLQLAAFLLMVSWIFVGFAV
jgi:hypothetical protein